MAKGCIQVGLILDADWLKQRSSRCLFHKLPPAKDMTLKWLVTIPSHPAIHCLISPTRQHINLISTVKKTRHNLPFLLDERLVFNSRALYNPCCLSPTLFQYSNLISSCPIGMNVSRVGMRQTDRQAALLQIMNQHKFYGYIQRNDNKKTGLTK